ncbi:MAG: hypothetical protein ACUVQF_01740 [Fervidobacterium sp.]|uniref:hypothetical protein n=1 Tax=Fervidobacterium sp. TaxID=1871331 RepID=UPI00404B23F3
MEPFFGTVVFLIGIVLNNWVSSLLLSRLILILTMIGIGFLIKNPYAVVVLTLLLLPSRYIYTPVGKDMLRDLRRFLSNRAMIRNKTYLTLVGTAGIFLGFALPAIKNYPISISVVIVVAIAVIYIVEYSNEKAFNDRVKMVLGNKSDQIEALKIAYEKMVLFSSTDVDDLIKNRIELFKNVNEKRKVK